MKPVRSRKAVGTGGTMGTTSDRPTSAEDGGRDAPEGQVDRAGGLR